MGATFGPGIIAPMVRFRFLPAALAIAISSPALAQVEVTTLAPPDLFSTPVGPDTGLGPDLWRGTSAIILGETLPRVSAKSLSPAAQGLARRLLMTGASGPDGAGNDPALGAARVQGLLALGEADGAAAILRRAPNLSSSSALSQAAAEAALIIGDDARACAMAEVVTENRGDPYWLRLRAFCEAIGGQTEAAQLTLTLATAREPKGSAYPRLMGALIAGAGSPGEASLKSGVEYALSRKLGLNMDAARAAASPAIAAHLTAPSPPPELAAGDLTAAETSALAFLRRTKGVVAFTEASVSARPVIASLVGARAPLQDPLLFIRAAVAAGDVEAARAIRGGLVSDSAASADDMALIDALIAAASGQADGPTLDRLVERGAQGGSKSPAQPAAMILWALAPAEGVSMSAQARGEFAAFEGPRSSASPARLAALDQAAAAGLKGETGLLALSIAADAGIGNFASADRARVVRALNRAGLTADARAFAAEGVLALQIK